LALMLPDTVWSLTDLWSLHDIRAATGSIVLVTALQAHGVAVHHVGDTVGGGGSV
jgi:hypothetical protein